MPKLFICGFNELMDAYRSINVSEADLKRALQNGVVIYILIEKKYTRAYYVGTDDYGVLHNTVECF